MLFIYNIVQFIFVNRFNLYVDKSNRRVQKFETGNNHDRKLSRYPAVGEKRNDIDIGEN